MIMNMNEKGRQTKLLAAVAIIAMVVCALAVVMPADEAQGATTNVEANGDLQAAIDVAASGDTLNITGAVTIDETIEVNKNITITSSSAQNITRAATFTEGDMFNVAAGATLTIAGQVTINGGGVFTDTDRTDDGVSAVSITSGAAQGVALYIAGTVNLEGSAKITGNINTEIVDGTYPGVQGSAAYVASTGTLNIKGGEISGNLTTYPTDTEVQNVWAYGVIYNLGTVNMSAGSITNNVVFAKYSSTVNGFYAGAFGTIAVRADSTFNMTGGSITNNVTDGIGNISSGGAIYVANGSVATLGGTITGNYASNGAAVYADEDANLTINNATINNNKMANITEATQYADVRAHGTVTLMGTNTIGYATYGAVAYVVADADTEITSEMISEAFENADTVTFNNGTIPADTEITIPAGKTFVIGNGLVFQTSGETVPKFTLTNATSFVTADSASRATFQVTGKDSTATFSNISGTMQIGYGSVVINNEEVSNASVEIDGATEIYGTITGNFQLTITAGPLSIPDGHTLTIAENATLTLVNPDDWTIQAGTLDIKGTIVANNTIAQDGKFTITGVTTDGVSNVKVYSTTQLVNTEIANGTYTPAGDQFEFGDTLNSSYTVTADEYLSQNLTIPAGVTLTIAANGNLNLAGYSIYVYGTLDIQSGGSVSGTSATTGNTLYMMRNGTITNAGVIGSVFPVTVSADTTAITAELNYVASGEVTLQNVSGVSFGLANTGTTDGDKPVYQMTVTGQVQTYGMSNSYVADFDGVRITGDLYIGQGITANFQNDDSILMSSATLTVDGTVNAGENLVMANNSTIVVNGNLSGTVTAQTGDYRSGSSYADIEGNVKDTTFVASATVPAGAYVSGYTLTVGTYEFQQGSGSNAVAMIAQRLYVDGTVSFVYTGQQTGNITYTGSLAFGGNNNPIVAEGSVLSLPSVLSVTGKVIVEGEINFPLTNSAAQNPVADYEGSYYTVTVTTPARATTGYIVPFETAIGAIATADGQKVTVRGDLEIVADLTIATGQTLDINGAVVTIDEAAEVILQTRATLSGAIYDVDGVFTAYNGATYVAPTNYDTYEQGTDYVRYSGIVAALDNASAGDVIDVTRPVDDVEDLTVPQGVTVNASADITISGDLVVETEAVLNMTNSATLALTGAKSTATIDGTLDLEEGEIAFTYSGTDVKENALTSAGTTVMTGTNFAAVSEVVNGAMYTNEDALRVITNAEAALAAAAAQAVNKTVTLYGTTSSGDLTAGVDIIVAEDARATVSSIALADGETVTLDGELTGAVTVQTGVAGSETASTVDLARASGIVITAGSVTDNQGVRTYELQLNGDLAGRLTVSAGTANICDDADAATLTVDGEGAVLTVASGATLVVGEGETLNVGDARAANANTGVDAVVVDGTLVADQGTVAVGYDSQNGYMLVAGTFQVADETDTITIAKGSVMTVTGTLDISTTEDKEAVVNVNGVLIVGEKPATVGAAGAGAVSGAVKVDNNIEAYIKAYNGANLSAALINIVNGETTIDSTAFYINSQLYMTVYAEGAVDVDNLLTAEKFSLTGYLTKYGMSLQDIDGIDIETVTDWYTDAEMSTYYNGTNPVVGNPEALYFKAQTATVDVVISVGQGISLYIDNIRMTSGATVPLTVGTHTVTATVDPGFKGDVTVQFNGQAVTGSFTITPEMAAGSYEGTVSVTATGNITQDSTVVVDGGSSDSGMGLTDYLLIILVILIVVMAIMVAMRLMRS